MDRSIAVQRLFILQPLHSRGYGQAPRKHINSQAVYIERFQEQPSPPAVDKLESGAHQKIGGSLAKKRSWTELIVFG